MVDAILSPIIEKTERKKRALTVEESVVDAQAQERTNAHLASVSGIFDAIDEDLRREGRRKVEERRAVRKRMGAVPPPGNVSSTQRRTRKEGYDTTTLPSILEYRRNRRKGLFHRNPGFEMRQLERIMDEGGMTGEEWRWAYHRWGVLWGRVYSPTARQRILGARPGSLSEEERRIVKVKEIAEAVLAALDEEI